MRYVCICPNYWGGGKTAAEAKANCKKAGGTLTKFRVYQTTDDMAYADPVNGALVTERGAVTTVVEERGVRMKVS